MPTNITMADADFYSLVRAVTDAATAHILDPDLRAMAGDRDAVVLALVSAGISPASSYEPAA
jgi:hypothetical protein